MDDVITVELIEYNYEKHEYIAKYKEREIIVDPYVGCAWDSSIVKLGTFTFDGHWFKNENHTFLPSKEILSSNELE